MIFRIALVCLGVLLMIGSAQGGVTIYVDDAAAADFRDARSPLMTPMMAIQSSSGPVNTLSTSTGRSHSEARPLRSNKRLAETRPPSGWARRLTLSVPAWSSSRTTRPPRSSLMGSLSQEVQVFLCLLKAHGMAEVSTSMLLPGP